jgi:hypothetical protein
VTRGPRELCLAINVVVVRARDIPAQRLRKIEGRLRHAERPEHHFKKLPSIVVILFIITLRLLGGASAGIDGVEGA